MNLNGFSLGKLVFLSLLGERLGEEVACSGRSELLARESSAAAPSPSLSPEGERNMRSR
jgi:hypothetical protein